MQWWKPKMSYLLGIVKQVMALINKEKEKQFRYRPGVAKKFPGT